MDYTPVEVPRLRWLRLHGITWDVYKILYKQSCCWTMTIWLWPFHTILKIILTYLWCWRWPRCTPGRCAGGQHPIAACCTGVASGCPGSVTSEFCVLRRQISQQLKQPWTRGRVRELRYLHFFCSQVYQSQSHPNSCDSCLIHESFAPFEIALLMISYD